ncbi:hypothetical protein UlMin_045610 [Ulmus minor]
MLESLSDFEVERPSLQQVMPLLRIVNSSWCPEFASFLIEDIGFRGGNLFLGSSATANNKSALKDLNITHIVNVTNCLEPSHLNDIVYKIINVVDKEDTNLRQYFEECFEFIDEGKRAGGCVFVHCFIRRSRSSTYFCHKILKRRVRLGFPRRVRTSVAESPLTNTRSRSVSSFHDFSPLFFHSGEFSSHPPTFCFPINIEVFV